MIHGTQGKRYSLPTLLLGLLLAAFNPAFSQTFDSTSDGSDGALDFSFVTPGETYLFDPSEFDPPLDADGDNIYHFTTIHVPAEVTVKLIDPKVHGPVYWLASGAVTIEGVVDLDGEQGHENKVDNQDIAQRKPAIPGSGGYPGGVGRLLDAPSQTGFGPGGGGTGSGTWGTGAGHSGPGFGHGSVPGGLSYGNISLVPLLGGSGGGGSDGDRGAGGGGGGGAILIASSISIAVNGGITANGGDGGIGSGQLQGGGGSGGGIHLMAPSISGTGVIEGIGGAASGLGASGRILLDAFNQNFTGTADPTPNTSAPVLTLPTKAPFIRVVRVGGVSVPRNNDASFDISDINIAELEGVALEIEARNIPPGTVAQVYLFADSETEIVVDTSPLSGTLASSTATATVSFADGFTRCFVRATWE